MSKENDKNIIKANEISTHLLNNGWEHCGDFYCEGDNSIYLDADVVHFLFSGEIVVGACTYENICIDKWGNLLFSTNGLSLYLKV